MKSLIVKFQSEDEKLMQELSKSVCWAMSSDDGKFFGVSVTAISVTDLFKQLEDIEDAEDMKEVYEILSNPNY